MTESKGEIPIMRMIPLPVYEVAMEEVTNPEPRQMKDESPKAFRERYARWKGLGHRKNGSAKAQNMRDIPDKAAHGVCLVCGRNRLDCICSGHMSEAAHKRFRQSV